MQNMEKQDIYSRITNQIVSHLEQGIRPWIKPWNAEHSAGRITRPLRHNGRSYSGINVLSLWASAKTQNFAAPIWMTFRQASELDAHVRKGERGSLVVYADSITRKETDDKTGDEVDREIPFLKGFTVFNVEQIEGLPDTYYAKLEPSLDPVQAASSGSHRKAPGSAGGCLFRASPAGSRWHNRREESWRCIQQTCWMRSTSRSMEFYFASDAGVGIVCAELPGCACSLPEPMRLAAPHTSGLRGKPIVESLPPAVRKRQPGEAHHSDSSMTSIAETVA